MQLVVPDSVQDYQAAQFLVNPLTAYAFLEAIAVPEGEWLLQNAANSVLAKRWVDWVSVNAARPRVAAGEV